MAEAIIQLSDALATLEPSRRAAVETATSPNEEHWDYVRSALIVLMEVRLLELQMTHEDLAARVDELEANLKMADGGDLAALSRAVPQSPEQTHEEQTTG